MKTVNKSLIIGFVSFFSSTINAQNCAGVAVKYTLDTVKTGSNWSVVYLQLPNGAHLDSIYGGIQRPGYTGTALSYACYSQGTTNDTNLLNPASNYYYPYTGPYGAWINMGAHNVVGKTNSYIQFSITTTDGMIMDSVKIAYSCATGCKGIIKKYTLDYHGTGSNWSYANLSLPDGAQLDSIYGGIQRPGYSGSALSYSCYSDSATNNVNLLNATTSFYNPYTGPYNAWINVTSYNVVGKSNSFVQFSITETSGMIFDSAIIAYSCGVPTDINEVSHVSNVIKVYPNPASNSIHIISNGQKFTEITITDMTGREVYHKPYTSTVDLFNIESGFYIIRLTEINGNICDNKIIVNK